MYARTIARGVLMRYIRGETGINLGVVAKIRNSRSPPKPISKSEILQSDRADKGVLERVVCNILHSLADLVLKCRSSAAAATDNAG